MAGVSGRYDAPSMFPYNARKQRPRNIITDNRVYDGDPLAFVLYLERPYIRLVILRLTDLTIRLYLQHALGLYDRPWYGWHRVSVRTGSQKKLINYRTRMAQVQTEIIFKFDHKEARRQLRPEDMLWPLWADLRKQAVEEANMFFAADLREITHSVLLNEIFFGLPPEECLSRYAVDRFIKKHSEFKETFEATAYGVFNGGRGEFREVTSFYPFSGSIRNIALGSGCHCHGEAFGPRFIQLGSDVRWTWLCDARTIPESLLQKQTSMITPPCRSDETTQPCACASRSGRAVCLCPTTAKCKKLPDSLIWSLPNSENIFLDSMRSAASLKTDLRMVQTMRRLAYDVVEPVQLDTPVSSTIFTNTAREIVIGQDTALGKNTGVVLAENEESWKQSDSCFTNIFTCRHGIVYRCWLFIDPDSIGKVPEDCEVPRLILFKHASSPDSPWHFMLTYEALQNRHFAGNESQKQVFVVGARLMAPPSLLWQVEGCSTDDIRLLPGRWSQVTVEWNTTHMTMLFNGRICATAPLATVHNVGQGDSFSPRNTPFVFFGISVRRRINETLCSSKSPTYAIRDFSFSVLKPPSKVKTDKMYSFMYLQMRVPAEGIVYLQEQVEILLWSVSSNPSNNALMNSKIHLPKTFLDNIFVTFTLSPLGGLRSRNQKSLTVLGFPELGFYVTLQLLRGNNWALQLLQAIEDEGCETFESSFFLPKVCLLTPCHVEIERGPSRNFTVVCQKERLTLISQKTTVSKQNCSQFIESEICKDTYANHLNNKSVLQCASTNLLPYSDVSLYFYPKPKLLEFGFISPGPFPTIECHFTQLEGMISGQINPNALALTDFCRLSHELAGLSINLLKVNVNQSENTEDSFEKRNARNPAFPISTADPETHPVLHVKKRHANCVQGCKPSTPALQCFHALEFCHFGVTVSFWMVYIPSYQKDKPSMQQTWRVAELVGRTNSRLSISLAMDWTDSEQRRDGEVALTLLAELRMDRYYEPEHTFANIWKATVSPSQMKDANAKWAFVVVSWSDFSGLEVSLNKELMAIGNRTLEREREVSKTPDLLTEGLFIGGLLAPDRWSGNAGEVLIDEFHFIPADRSRLDSIEQDIGFDPENAKIPMCNIDTCLVDLTCRDHSERKTLSSKSRLCRCMSPRRFCTEIPPNPNLRNGRQPKGKPSTRPLCTPACLNSGLCRWTLIKGTWKSVCDCSRTFYWGDSCQHEYVGRLPFEDQDEFSAPDQNSSRTSSFAFVNVESENNIRLLFRIPVNSAEKEIEKYIEFHGRTRRSAPERSNMSERKDVLLSFEGENGTICALAIFNHQIGYTCDSKLANPRAWVSLVPCSEPSSVTLDNGMMHALEIDLQLDYFRVRVDHQPFYPPEVQSFACKEEFTDENWIFVRFTESVVSSVLDRTAKLGEIEKQASVPQVFHKIFMGAWPDGSDEFPGALGGFKKNNDSMILPTFTSSDEKTNGIYRFNKQFNASHRRIKWILMSSLTPVTVRFDDEDTNYLETNGIYIIQWLVGSLFLLIVLSALFVLLCLLRWKAKDSRGFACRKCVWMPRINLCNKSPLRISANLLRVGDVRRSLLVPCANQSHRLLSSTTTKEPRLPLVTDAQKSKSNTRILTLGKPSSFTNANIQLPAFYPRQSHVDAYDVERFMVTVDGQTIITMTANSGLSLKLWSMKDGSCQDILTQNKSTFQKEPPDSVDFALLERNQCLLAGYGQAATLWTLPFLGKGEKVHFQLKSPVWNIFGYEDVFLIVSAPTQSGRNECFAVLSVWSPDTKAFLYQTNLCIPKDNPLKDTYMRIIRRQCSKPQAVLISPGKSCLLFRWRNTPNEFQSGFETQTKQNLGFISAAVRLDGIQEELRYLRKPILFLMKQPKVSINKQPFDVSMTKFLTETFVLSGCSNGTLQIWDVNVGKVLRTLKNDPIPTQNPLLPDTIQANLGFSESTLSSITSIAVSNPSLDEIHPFNWLCSGDNSGCIVVRRYSVGQSQQTGMSSIAVRIHGTFGPLFKKVVPFHKDSVTCMCLLDIAGYKGSSRVTLLASGDTVGCIRLWLLPQCTELAQLSASCEGSLVDLVLTQYATTTTPTNNPETDVEKAVKERWVQVTGLVSAQAMDASQERGRVVVAHVNANENCSLRNVTHSPRIRHAHK